MKRFLEIVLIPFWILVVIWDLIFPTKVDVHKYFKNQDKNK